MNDELLKGAEPFFRYLLSDVFEIMVESYGEEIAQKLFDDLRQNQYCDCCSELERTQQLIEEFISLYRE